MGRTPPPRPPGGRRGFRLSRAARSARPPCRRPAVFKDELPKLLPHDDAGRLTKNAYHFPDIFSSLSSQGCPGCTRVSQPPRASRRDRLSNGSTPSKST